MRVRSLAWPASWLVLSGLAGCSPQADARAEAPGEALPQGAAASRATARYLANAAVLIASGETKIVFDPLFRNDYGSYRLVPQELEHALFAGEPPLDGIDAVFISHHHEDHFSPADVLRLLREQTGIHLYAPAQAVAEITALAAAADREALDRVHPIVLAYGDPPVTIEAGPILVEAVRIPHSGWPERQRDVENIAYRVTLDERTTVLHLGDADDRDEHYARDAEHWARRHTHMAFPPYWYFLSESGRHILEERLAPGHAVGVHVPVNVPPPAARPPELAGVDLFVEPGETRDIPR